MLSHLEPTFGNYIGADLFRLAMLSSSSILLASSSPSYILNPPVPILGAAKVPF